MPRSSSLLLLLLGLFLAGCGPRITPVQKANADKILLLGNGAEPSDLDPQATTSVTESHITRSLFEGLTTYHPQTCEPVPGVAEKWETSADGLEWTFHLRPTAKWSNGDPLTASDFVWSYQRILSPAFASEYAYMLFVLENAEDYYLRKSATSAKSASAPPTPTRCVSAWATPRPTSPPCSATVRGFPSTAPPS